MVTKDLRGILDCGLRGGTGVRSQASLSGKEADLPGQAGDNLPLCFAIRSRHYE